jgi:putative flippase GtrA
MNPCATRPAVGAEPGACADSSLAVQFLRYLVVGGIAFLADFGTLALLTSGCGWHYLQAAAVAFGIGIAVTYVLSVTWVFKVRVVKSQHVEFLLFALIGLAGLGITQLMLWTLTDGLNLYYLHAKLITSAVVLGWNFAARKLLLFTSPRPTGSQEMVQI